MATKTQKTKAAPAEEVKTKVKAEVETRGRKKSQMRLDIEKYLLAETKANKKAGVVIVDVATEFSTSGLTVLRIAQELPRIRIEKVNNKNVAFVAAAAA